MRPAAVDPLYEKNKIKKMQGYKYKMLTKVIITTKYKILKAGYQNTTNSNPEKELSMWIN